MFIDLFRNLFPSKANSKNAGKSILIIEDNVGQQVLYSRTLQKKGYQVAVAGNGADGVKAAVNGHFHLILLDFVLPDCTGADVCQRLKELAVTKDIPVIVLTSKDSPTSVINCYQAGAAYYLAKPVGAGTLLHHVELTLEESNLR